MLTAKDSAASGVAPLKESALRSYVGNGTLILFCSLSPILLAAPCFMHSMGIPLSITLIVLSAIYAIYAQKVLLEAAYHVAATSFSDFFRRIFRPRMYHLVMIATILACLPIAELLTLTEQAIGVYAAFSHLSTPVNIIDYTLIKILIGVLIVLPLTLLPRSSLPGLVIGYSLAGVLFIIVFFYMCVVFADWKMTGYVASYRHEKPSIPIIPFEFHGRTTVFSPLYYIHSFWIAPVLIGYQNRQHGSYSSRYCWAIIVLSICVSILLLFIVGISVLSILFFDGICTAVSSGCLLLQSNYILSLMHSDPLSGNYLIPAGMTVFVLLYTLSLVIATDVKLITVANVLVEYVSRALEMKRGTTRERHSNKYLQYIQKMAGYEARLPVGRSMSEPELIKINAEAKNKKIVPCKMYFLYLFVSGPLLCLTLATVIIIPDLAVLSSLIATIIGCIVCLLIPINILYMLPYLRSMSAGRNIDLCAMAARYRENSANDHENMNENSSSALLDFYSSDTDSVSGVTSSNTSLSGYSSAATTDKLSISKAITIKSLKSITTFSKAGEGGGRRDSRKGSTLEKDIAAVSKWTTTFKAGTTHKEITEDDLESISPGSTKEHILRLDTFKAVSLRMRERPRVEYALTAENAPEGIAKASNDYETIQNDNGILDVHDQKGMGEKEQLYAVGVVILGTLPDFSNVQITASRRKKALFLTLVLASICFTVISLIFQIVFLV